ncbi:MAG: DUF1788 domain-containing protein [Ardenticatenia bacterium]|nr:DUF1788 domain-containing protein [Ardenticatenia bacterium]
MNRIDALRANYARYASLPWDSSLPGQQRIWFGVYDPADERKLRLRLPGFEIATREAGHGWRRCDLTDAFALWMAGQDYREAYFESPEDLGCPHPDFERFVAERLRSALEAADERTVVAVHGVATLFGFMKVSRLMELVQDAVQGRLLVFFPGEYANNNYRLLDAGDGWNYHAVPITAATEMEGA